MISNSFVLSYCLCLVKFPVLVKLPIHICCSFCLSPYFICYCTHCLTVNGTQLPSINHLPSSLLSHGRKAVGKPLHLQSPLKWCGISIATVLACSCVCLARSGHLMGPPVGSCELGLLLYHGTCGPNGIATALVKSSVSSSCIRAMLSNAYECLPTMHLTRE